MMDGGPSQNTQHEVLRSITTPPELILIPPQDKHYEEIKGISMPLNGMPILHRIQRMTSFWIGCYSILEKPGPLLLLSGSSGGLVHHRILSIGKPEVVLLPSGSRTIPSQFLLDGMST